MYDRCRQAEMRDWNPEAIKQGEPLGFPELQEGIFGDALSPHPPHASPGLSLAQTNAGERDNHAKSVPEAGTITIDEVPASTRVGAASKYFLPAAAGLEARVCPDPPPEEQACTNEVAPTATQEGAVVNLFLQTCDNSRKVKEMCEVKWHAGTSHAAADVDRNG